MAYDASSVRTLLKVNGLTKDTPDEQIREALYAANYEEADVHAIVAALKAGTLGRDEVEFHNAQLEKPSESIIPNAALRAEEGPQRKLGIKLTRRELVEVVVGMVLLAAILSLLVLYGIQALEPIILLINGTILEIGIQPYLMLEYAVASVAALTVIFISSWSAASSVGPCRPLTIWLSSLIAHYVVIWFSISQLLRNAVELLGQGIPVWALPVIDFVKASNTTLYTAAFIVIGGLALPIAAFAHYRSGSRVGGYPIAAFLVYLAALAILLYLTGYVSIAELPL